LLDSNKKWNKQDPIIADHPLTMLSNLTENDLVLRQINYSPII
jgi:hypothetical protein